MPLSFLQGGLIPFQNGFKNAITLERFEIQRQVVEPRLWNNIAESSAFAKGTSVIFENLARFSLQSLDVASLSWKYYD